MIRCPDLPLLPGYSFNNNVGQSRFNKSHHFEVRDVGYLTDKDLPATGGALFPGRRANLYPSVYTKGESPALPPWISYDRQTLKFDAYFQEAIPEVSGYSHVVRKCNIYFYLEDGTIKVVEPKIPNSGFAQGCLISRQRISLPNSSNGDVKQFYDIIDLNVGRTVELYSRVFKITNCDGFTRNFLNRLGIPVGDPLEAPVDPYTQKREILMKQEMQSRKPGPPKLDFTKFLDLDGKVLFFTAYWDDRGSQYGDVHTLEVRYYLSDDTIDVKDVSDKDHTFLLMHRDKLPKEFKGMTAPGCSITTKSFLNVMDSGHSLPDSLTACQDSVEHYKDSDLLLGTVINVYGRNVILTDCDLFTKEYYRVKYGIVEFKPIHRPLTNDEVVVKESKRSPPELPPFNGFGTHEDSAINCRTVFPMSATKSYKQFYEKDRFGYDSRILRFRAELVSNKPNDKLRSFIVSYYLSDDTVSVFETVEENSGYSGGMMVSRRKITKPGQYAFGSKPPVIYDVQDFYIGNELEIETYKYNLVGADEYALRYMETHSNEFPKSNVNFILSKVINVLRPNYKEFVARHLVNDAIPVLTLRQFRESMKYLLGNDITEHEITTLARHYSSDVQIDPLPNDLLRGIIQNELKKYLFNAFERLDESFRYRDEKNTGKVSKDSAYSILRGAKLPVDGEVTHFLLDKMCMDEAGNVNYKDILYFLDYKKNPAPSVPPMNIASVLSAVEKIKHTERSRKVELVQFEKLIKDTNLEKELVQQSS